jgi:hypothetical protein
MCAFPKFQAKRVWKSMDDVEIAMELWSYYWNFWELLGTFGIY